MPDIPTDRQQEIQNEQNTAMQKYREKCIRKADIKKVLYKKDNTERHKKTEMPRGRMTKRQTGRKNKQKARQTILIKNERGE